MLVSSVVETPPASRGGGGHAVLSAFDLIQLKGDDLRRLPIEQRKAELARLVRGAYPGMVLNAHIGDGEIVFEDAYKLGREDIVSKRLSSPYRSLKIKNPAEEDWGR